MARPANITDQMVEAAQQLVKKGRYCQETQSGIIPKVCGVNNAITGQVLNVGVATVVRMQKEIREQVAGKPVQKGSWGGRRRQHLSVEQEIQFLEPWIKKAQTGGVLVVPPIHRALEQRLGYPVAASTVYRLLARHGWRKVAPDTCHPKQDAQTQEEFKKNSPKQWHKLSSKTG